MSFLWSVYVGRPGNLLAMPGHDMTPTYAYAVVGVTDPAEMRVHFTEDEDRPVEVLLGGLYYPTMVWLSRPAAEALVDQLVAALVVGGDPDAAPF